ncbi:MAG: histidine--tRNA ligase [Patescibacteria group bacterium]
MTIQIRDTANGNRIPAQLPGGFRDYAPEEMILKNRILDTARRTFENFGYEPMDTAAVQRTNVLVGDDKEFDKITFRVTPAQRGEITDLKRDETSLRFDLTVPLARFMAAHPDIPKPFRRYQIGKVWRGESPQRGRYREFTQADIDIAGSSSIEADAEVIAAMNDVLERSGVKNFVFKINNYKIASALPEYAGIPNETAPALLREADKISKIGVDAFRNNLKTQFGFAPDTVETVNRFFSVRGRADAALRKLHDMESSMSKPSPLFGAGVNELRELASILSAMGVPASRVEIDTAIVRGLSYYTGSIFETMLTDQPAIGSICSGGRYDTLMEKFTASPLPMVGMSLGVDRLLAALEEGDASALKTNAQRPQVLIFNLAPEFRSDYYTFASELRSADISAALYIGDDRAFQAQLAYAVKKDIPFVLIYGEDEKKKGVVAVKDLRAREQLEMRKSTVIPYLTNRVVGV